MSKKIDKLTAEQEVELVRWYDRSLAAGRNTEPANRPATEQVFANFAKLLGRDKPFNIWWWDGPASAYLAAILFTNLLHNTTLNSQLDSQLSSQLRSQLYSQLGSQLRSQFDSQLNSKLYSQIGSQLYLQISSQISSQIGSQIDSQLRSQLGSQLRDQLYSQLYSQLRDQLYSQLDSQLNSQLYLQFSSRLREQLDLQLGSQLRSQLYSQLNSQLYLQLYSQLYLQLYSQLNSQLGFQLGLQFRWYGGWGQHESYWTTFYSFVEFIGCRMTDDCHNLLNNWITLNESAGWWCAFGNDDIFVCERPSIQAVDSQGRLHDETGPAFLSRDGFSFYSWHGVVVPRAVIETPETLTVHQITSEPNTEIRRVMMERFGYERYVKEIGARRVDAMDDIELYRVTRSNDSDLVMVAMTNSTAEPDGSYKVYWERVHPELRPFRRRKDGTVWLGEIQDDRAINAVASRFGLYGHEYNLSVQT